MSRIALTGAAIVLPDRVVDGHALLIDGDRIAAIVPYDELDPTIPVEDLGGGWLLPGFIDTQVNGGGDVLFNDRPSVEGIRAIAAAHRRFGTTGMLPTLISDDPDVVAAAIEATAEAIAIGVPGVLGIHVEGPHLHPDKRGIHDAGKFTVLGDAAIERLTRATGGVTLTTVAPELAPAGAVRRLTQAGVRVAAAHSMADYDQTVAAIGEGLAGFTHLFNAMSQLGSREPGMVGAALDDRRTRFGLIVDGLHVHPATMRVALAARGLDGVMLVTDAMPPVGGERARFELMGRTIEAVDGVCRGEDGTLGGSALSMAQALRNAMTMLGLDIVQASRAASGTPAAFLGLAERIGTIAPGLAADLVHLDADHRVVGTWIGGVRDERGEDQPGR